MFNSLRRVAGTTVAVLSCSFALSACGGGGGSAPAIAPPPPPPTTAAKSVVRGDAQAALGVMSSAQILNGGTTVLGATRHALDLRRGRSVRGREPQSVATCSTGSTGGSYSYASAVDGSGNTIDTYSSFYDTACAQPELVEVITFPPSSSQTTATANAVVTSYDRSGAVNGYATLRIVLTLSGTVATITITSSAAKTAGGVPYGQLGVTCSATSATAAACGLATVSTVGTPTGLTLAITDSSTTGNPYTTTETFSASTYTGAAMGIAQGSGTAWNVTGGTLTDTLSGTLTLTISGSIPIGGTIAMTDATTGVTIAGSVTASSLTMTVAQNGTTLATVALDANGTGTIRYADGTTETVTAYTIVG